MSDERTPEQKRRDRIKDKQRSFRSLAMTAPGQLILRDLANFCYAHESTVTGAPVDPNLVLVLEGRRQVWNRIQQYLKLTEDEVWALSQGARQ